jgi:hypothetical protein
VARPHFVRSLAAIVAFAVAFGYVEAAVVVYLRALYEPIHQRLHPDRPSDDLFPVIRLDQLEAEGTAARRQLDIEVIRELATLVMLGAIGLAVGRTFHEGFAAFVVAFGIWDIFFYVFLKLLIDWPDSLLTWDLLFLLPVPWTGPVLAPVIVAGSMVGSGIVVLAREDGKMPVRLTRGEWAAVCTGGILLVSAFCWDFRNILGGGVPNAFHWPLFAVGEILGLAGFLRAVRRR